SGPGDVRVPPLAEQAGLRKRNLARRLRPERLRPGLCRGGFLRHLCPERTWPGRSNHRAARRLACDRSERADPPRGLDLGCFAFARARHAIRAVLVYYRRRAAREGARPGARRRSRRRRGESRRDGGVAEILRRAATPRGIRRSFGTATATAL